MNQTPQLALPLINRAPLTWDTFVIGENQNLVSALTHIAQTPARAHSVSFSGISGAGKTHALVATYKHICDTQKPDCVQFLDLAQLGSAPEQLQQLEPRQINLLDNIGVFAGQVDLEHALFGFIERVRQAQAVFVCSSKAPISAGGWTLPDLSSRLSADLLFVLRALSDEATKVAIKRRLNALGFQPNEVVLDYVVTHLPRDKHALFEQLDELEGAAAIEQRRMTIPFIKEYLQR